MKLSLILTLLTCEVGAISRASLVSSIHNTVSKANIPGVLAIAAEKSRELATETLPQATVQSAKWVAANPGTTVAGGAAVAGLVLVVAPASVAAPGLAAVGFGADGIIAGVFALSSPSFLNASQVNTVSVQASSAAAAQSSIGPIVSPSLFATLQSAGAGGYGVATVYPAVQVVGGAITSFAGASVAWVKSKSGPKA